MKKHRIGPILEPKATDIYLMRLLSSVNPPVCVQAGTGGESFVAEVTFIRPLPCVDPYVPLQQAGSVKLLSASITGQQSF